MTCVVSEIFVGKNICHINIIAWCFCHQPVQPQYYYGPNFGYIVAFKPHDGYEWRKVIVSDPQAKRYVHKDSSIPPSAEFQVKVKAFNSKGEGPFSLTAVIYSAQDGKHDVTKQCHRSTWSCFLSIAENDEFFNMPTLCYFNLSMPATSHYQGFRWNWTHLIGVFHV